MRAPLFIGLTLISLFILLLCQPQERSSFGKAFDLNELPEEEEEQEQFGLDKQPEVAPRKQGIWNRLKQRLPKYFDFEQFTKQFGKQYKRAEELARKSIFLRNVLEVFKARVDFRLGKSSSLRQVNKFSDRSDEELRAMLVGSEPPIGESEKEEKKFREELERKRRELSSRESQLMIETDSQAASGQADQQQPADLLERLLDDASQETLWAVEDELRELGIETDSQTAASRRSASASGSAQEWPCQESRADWEARLEEESRELPDSRDWSSHYCFHEIYDQGQECGKCYILSATALAEFYKCAELGATGKLQRRKFSKDFVFECAQKFSPNVMGCAGGSPLDALRFLSLAGANNIREWRDLKKRHLALLRQHLGGSLQFADALDLRCPLRTHELPMKRWGASTLDAEPLPVEAKHWKAALEDGPLVAWIQVPTLQEFFAYAGGVHSGEGCANSGAWHAMLLVGHGRDTQTGLDFWRFRNSFGPDWGEQGHFRMAQTAPEACLTGGVRLVQT